MKPFVALMCYLAFSIPTKPHKFEDGFVERTMAVIVRGELAYVEYSVGLNEMTLKEILLEWDEDSKSMVDTPLTSVPTQEPKQSSADADKKSAGAQAKTTDLTTRLAGLKKDSPVPISNSSKAPNAQGDQRPPAEPASGKAKARAKDRANAQSEVDASIEDQESQSLNDQEPDTEADSDSEAESDNQTDSDREAHAIAPELLTRFRETAVEEIPKRLTVTCDGNPLSLENVSIGPPPRHPFLITIKFQFRLPKTGQCQLKIADANFLNQTGARRQALKGTGKSMLLRSNVEPVLLRSERVVLGKREKADTDEQVVIDAKLLVGATETD